MVQDAYKEYISFVGMLSGDRKWGALYGCEAFVLPSHQENFGIAVVEALACGKPVLISNQVNIWKEVDKEGAGLISADEEAGVEGLIKNWLSLNELAKLEMRKKAILCYEKNFTISGYVERIYEEI